MSEQTPFDNTDACLAAAGNLAFLLSVIRCGEQLSADEEAAARRLITRLQSCPSRADREEALKYAFEQGYLAGAGLSAGSRVGLWGDDLKRHWKEGISVAEARTLLQLGEGEGEAS